MPPAPLYDDHQGRQGMPLPSSISQQVSEPIAAGGKRTRGPRSCDQCRVSKQRCEQFDVAGIVPSNEPQPYDMTCRRCRVLQLPCIVADVLPKSTRLRMERAAAAAARRAPARVSLSPPPSSSAAPNVYNATSTSAGPSISSSQPVASGSQLPAYVSSATRNRFDPQVFDPTPVLQTNVLSPHSTLRTDADSSFSSPQGYSASVIGKSQDGSTDSSSAHSTAANAPLNKSLDWSHRARIATRPLSLMEHLAPPPSKPAKDVPHLETLPPLKAIVDELLADSHLRQRLSRRFRHLQASSMAFLPAIDQLTSQSGEDASLLLAVGLLLEGFRSDPGQYHGAAIYAYIRHYCLTALRGGPLAMWTICALLLVATHCPQVIPRELSQGHKNLTSHSLLTSLFQAAQQMGLPSACEQVRHLLDGPNMIFVELEGTVVVGASLWSFLQHQMALLELHGCEERDFSSSTHNAGVHPSLVSSHAASSSMAPDSATSASAEADIIILEQLFKRILTEHEEQPKAETAGDLQRCANHLLATLRARACLQYSQGTRELLLQLKEQCTIWRLPDDRMSSPAAAISALRRWTEKVIGTISQITALMTQESHRVMAAIGSATACETATLAYVEAELASYEVLAASRIKDRMFDAGLAITGPCKASQEFLYGLFSTPSLLKPYEEMGIFRTRSCKHLLILLNNLVVDAKMASEKSARQFISPSSRTGSRIVETSVVECAGIADALAVPRWAGIMVACASALAEEIAGRFMAKEPPVGAHNDSRFEITSSVLTHSVLLLDELAQDARARCSGSNEAVHYDLAGVLGAALESIRAIRKSLARWRMQATGVGQYTHTVNPVLGALSAHSSSGMDSSRVTAPLRLPGADIASLLHDGILSDKPAPAMSGDLGHSGHENVYATSTKPPDGFSHGKPGMMGAPDVPASLDTLSRYPVTHDAKSTGLDNVTFGDALLADILFTPIESFFQPQS